MFPISTLHNKIFLSANFETNFCPIFPILAHNLLVQNCPKFFFVMQSGYGEQTLYNKFFSFIIEKNLFVQWFHFRKQGFVIFLTGATKSDFFENGRWNYMTIASKPHNPFLWRISMVRFQLIMLCTAFCVRLYNGRRSSRCLLWYL